MSAVTSTLRHRARRTTASALALTVLVAPLALPGAAAAQFGVPVQTKEEARKAQESARSTSTGGGGISTQTALILGAVVVMAAAGGYILIDSRGAVRGEVERPGPQPLAGGSAGRGVPKTMFGGEAAPGARTGKAKKREKTRRQKQARRRNR